MLKLRSTGIRDYNVLEDDQLIGRICYASERSPGIWIWKLTVHVPGGLPMGTATDLEAAKVAFKTAWALFKAKHAAELPDAFRAMNIRKD
jgi:hypothetical protein